LYFDPENYICDFYYNIDSPEEELTSMFAIVYDQDNMLIGTFPYYEGEPIMDGIQLGEVVIDGSSGSSGPLFIGGWDPGGSSGSGGTSTGGGGTANGNTVAQSAHNSEVLANLASLATAGNNYSYTGIDQNFESGEQKGLAMLKLPIYNVGYNVSFGWDITVSPAAITELKGQSGAGHSVWQPSRN
jgi:hypothetical protein